MRARQNSIDGRDRYDLVARLTPMTSTPESRGQRPRAQNGSAVASLWRAPLVSLLIVAMLFLGFAASLAFLTYRHSSRTLPPPGIARNDALVRIRGVGVAPARSGTGARIAARMMSAA